MNTIHVTASRNYDVIIGSSLLSKAGEYLLATLNRTGKIAMISESNVFPLYGELLIQNL